MDLEMYRNDDVTADEAKDKCLNSLNDILWMSPVKFTNKTTIESAIELARQRLDGGLEGTFQLQPSNLNFHRWMQFAHLCTILHKRNRAIQKYTILRIATYTKSKSHHFWQRIEWSCMAEFTCFQI